MIDRGNRGRPCRVEARGRPSPRWPKDPGRRLGDIQCKAKTPGPHARGGPPRHVSVPPWNRLGVGFPTRTAQPQGSLLGNRRKWTRGEYRGSPPVRDTYLVSAWPGGPEGLSKASGSVSLKGEGGLVTAPLGQVRLRRRTRPLASRKRSLPPLLVVPRPFAGWTLALREPTFYDPSQESPLPA